MSSESLPGSSSYSPLSISQRMVFAAGLAALSLAGYLVASALAYRLGFPLDDAWIHQTYARNLALRGEWAFIPGQPSAGSTAPLWSALLAVGHLLRLGPYLWTYALGWALLAILGQCGDRAFRRFSPGRAGWRAFAVALLILEWHLVWSAASGMETLLFAVLALVVLARLAAGGGHPLELGLLIGLSAWVRPDGISLLGPAALALVLGEKTGRPRVKACLLLGLGFALLFIPYLVFNRLLAGAWWPNTFYAKQAEYALLQQLPFWRRYLSQAQPLVQGAGAALLPGLLLFTFTAFRRRAWGSLAGGLWLVGYLGLYAWRLPAAYQHGRYLIPVMPAFLLMGLAGLASWVQPGEKILWRRVVGRVWALSAGVLLVMYWFFGASAYAGDVAFIESEMVTTAQWVAENSERGALVAAHDIGALGYFGEHPLIDLAGLVSPEVIPIIRNEARLAVFLDERNADYLVTFPGWYPELVRSRVPVFESMGAFSPRLGGENLAVYRWK